MGGIGIIELIFSEEDVEDVLCDVMVDFEVLELLVDAWEDVVEVVSATLGIMAFIFTSTSKTLAAAAV